ncbi:hypothetical protein BAUCODRAFT_244370 [Baudoinia panamericana UAMH 10762]|uniref:Uncharacterized protein n=1 Tax=Baudoinia panamericana (strain UAMH 10762) TaxID=717646 RepID=M2MAP4_BAUPA|nr:uncharacterized protein BAUCODRAFT_244370 [Baudoinia panamericana UAMH 10762]EMC93516.1 hypothetical protein BAUCODRAFT_244370 [Baudoinia panamericana UAMH 10762]
MLFSRFAANGHCLGGSRSLGATMSHAVCIGLFITLTLHKRDGRTCDLFAVCVVRGPCPFVELSRGSHLKQPWLLPCRMRAGGAVERLEDIIDADLLSAPSTLVREYSHAYSENVRRGSRADKAAAFHASRKPYATLPCID